MGGPLGKVLDEMIDEFNSTHPDIEVVSVSMGNYQALSQKIMAAVTADKPPVIAQVYESWTAQLLAAGKIVSIDTFVFGEQGLSKEELEDIFPVFIEDNTFDGQLVTFPFNKSVPAYFYNIDMFKKAGICLLYTSPSPRD